MRSRWLLLYTMLLVLGASLSFGSPRPGDGNTSTQYSCEEAFDCDLPAAKQCYSCRKYPDGEWGDFNSVQGGGTGFDAIILTVDQATERCGYMAFGPCPGGVCGFTDFWYAEGLPRKCRWDVFGTAEETEPYPP